MKSVKPKVNIIAVKRLDWLFATMKIKQVTNKYDLLIVYDAPRESWKLAAGIETKDKAMAKMDEYYRRFYDAAKPIGMVPTVGSV